MRTTTRDQNSTNENIQTSISQSCSTFSVCDTLKVTKFEGKINDMRAKLEKMNQQELDLLTKYGKDRVVQVGLNQN